MKVVLRGDYQPKVLTVLTKPSDCMGSIEKGFKYDG